MRNAHKEKSKTNRYKIVNCLRSQNIEPNKINAENPGNAHITIVDVEAEINEIKNTQESKPVVEKYVYDLYYTSSDYFGDVELEEQENIR